LKLGRSLRGRTRKIRFSGQGINPKSKIIPLREVRESRSSKEVG
jgi:hypothetical protein